MKVGTVKNNVYTFHLSSSLIRRLIVGPYENEALKVSGHGPRAKIG